MFGLLANWFFLQIEVQIVQYGNYITAYQSKKHEFVVELSEKEVASILVQHEECYEKGSQAFVRSNLWKMEREKE